ncbi:unnamed protein product [Meloidogyne enterolobii]|uniref:Uncharacterized protein n=1 Tax=Meloidogyne enterolobii TaxID=390850 RepID=A0ACB0Z3H1_MELEN
MYNFELDLNEKSQFPLEYNRATGTEEEFKRVLEWQEKFFKAFFGEEKYEAYVKLSGDKDKYDQLVKFVKPYARKLKDILKAAEDNASAILKYIFFEELTEVKPEDVKDALGNSVKALSDELPKLLIKEKFEKVLKDESKDNVKDVANVENVVKLSKKIKNVLGIQQQTNLSDGDVIKYLKELYKIAYEMKMKPGKPVKRPCYITVGKVCIIDVCMFLNFIFKYYKT